MIKKEILWNDLACFEMSLYINMKIFKNTARLDFMRVNIALNSQACEEKLDFYTRVHKKMHLLLLFKS